MVGMTKEQIDKWRMQGYNILQNGVPHRTFGDLWEYLDRLDEENDNVIVLEDAAQWSDAELAGFWDAQKASVINSPPEYEQPGDISKSS